MNVTKSFGKTTFHKKSKINRCYRSKSLITNHFVKQLYTDGPIPPFYQPTQEGKEDGLKKRLEKLWGLFSLK